jgi:secreted protein with Ig-like and vWFA domain
MEKIVLEVDDATGKVYRNFSPENKKKFNLAVNIVLKKAINDAGAVNYKKMLDEIGTEAVSNGLTPEILNGLLSSDD